MAAVVLENQPETTPPLAAAQTPRATEDAGLDAIAVALGMDPNSVNELQKPDVDWLKEMQNLPFDLSQMPSGTDIEGMRKWVRTIFSSEGYASERARFQSNCRYPTAKITKTVVSVPVHERSNESFDLWIYEPLLDDAKSKSELRPVILMFHGGGWIHGDPSGDEVYAEIFASALNAVVIGVDYRLAPENRFPAPIEDAMCTLDWLCHNAQQYRADVTRIGLFGVSAGGNIAAACALRAAEFAAVKEWKIRLVSLVVPVTAHTGAEATFDEKRVCGKSHNEKLFANAPPIPDVVSEEIRRLYSLYVGDSDPCDRLASPLAATPTRDHPPTLMTIAGCDALRPQGLKYAQLLRSSGVQVDEDILGGVPHGFTFAMNSKLVTSWFARQVEAFQSRLQTGGR